MPDEKTFPARNRRTDVLAEAKPRDLPATPRGVRTRARRVQAARTVFERDGFIDARLVDITNEAEMSAGSFYTYFDSKEEILSAVLGEVEEEMLHPQLQEVPTGDDPVEIIRASNRAYLESYRRNVKLMKLLDQISSIDDNFRQLRRRRGDAFAHRNARSIRALQERGQAKADIDPLLSSYILSGMVGRAAHAKFVLDENWDLDELVDTLTTLWANALLISTD